MVEKWWEKPVAYICNHLIIFALAFLGIITSTIFLSTQGNREIAVQDSTPITESELEELRPRLKAIASVYSSPVSRIYSDHFLDSGEIATQPEGFSDNTQVVRGKLSKKGTIDELGDDWPSASVIWIGQEQYEILGLYRGNVDNIEQGENILVEGIYVVEGDGINIDSITSDSALEEPQRSISSSNLFFYLVAGITTLWAIFVLFRSIKNKPKPSHPELLLLLICCGGLLLSSCDIQIQNIIDPSGQGTAITTICEDQDNVDFFYEIPEAPDYIADRIANFRHQGGFYEETSVGNKQCFTLQQNFSGSGDFSYDPNSSQDDSENWAYIDQKEYAQYDTFRYTAKINTSSLYGLNTSINSTIRGEVQDSLDEIDMVYSVYIPGEVIYNNADQLEGNTGYWNIPMDESREIVIESRVEKTLSEESEENLINKQNWLNIVKWIVVAIIFIVSTIFFFKN